MPTGALLTGGASRRMGRTKALVEVGGAPMGRHVADALAAAGCDPVVLVGGDPAELDVLGIRLVPDRYPGDGPLGGVITALAFASGAALVVACDLPNLTGDTVGVLLVAAAGHPDADVVVATTDRIEPGCALWRPSALPVIVESFESGERALHRAIGRLRSVEVALPAAALANINEPGDLFGNLPAVAISEITVQELEALGPGVRLVDVREAHEWEAGHVPYAVHVPLGTLPDNLDRLDGSPTYLICRSGGRSSHACQFAAANGLDAVNVTGGMLAWLGAGYESASGA